jgi:hypothetical protein
MSFDPNRPLTPEEIRQLHWIRRETSGYTGMLMWCYDCGNFENACRCSPPPQSSRLHRLYDWLVGR